MTAESIRCSRCGGQYVSCGCHAVIHDELETAFAVRGGVTIHPRYGLPAYTPTEPQPTRCGGTEA